MTEGIPPYALIRKYFEFPSNVEDRDWQIEWINALAPLARSGHWAEVGTGKTFAATCCVLYKRLLSQRRRYCIVTMPPILIRQWRRWLEKIIDRRTGKRLAALEYRGSPKRRRELNLHEYQFILMSMQIFKKDYDYLMRLFEHEDVDVIVDEAHSVKNIESDNFKRTRDFATGRDLLLLTGTPLSKPGDAYAYIKLISPQVYRNHNHFEALHVEERDFFGNVTKWSNLEFLRDNLLLNSVRVLKEKALPYLKKPLYIPIPYALAPEHQKLYERLAEEQLLLLENGGKIDATTGPRLYNALQQIVCNPGHFSGDPEMESAAHELLDQTIEELGVEDPANSKLIISSNYRMTNRGLLEYLKPYNAVGLYSEISPKRQDENKERFVDDRECRVICIQPESAGAGTDGWQTVCSNVYFMESPVFPRPFHQVVGRVDRDGQVTMPQIRMPMAEKTIQVKLFNDLLKKDELVNKVQPALQDLREAIYGAAAADAGN
jgi:SNF2 family DNA or RNA helicase